MDSSLADAPRILIIEDDATTRETYQHMLTAHGYVVLPASSVSEGLNSIRAEVPDVVLLDFHMPAADGLHCLRALRSSGKTSSSVPVAIITGDYFIEESIADDLKQLGTRIYFKPVWEDDIIQIVRELLRQSVSPRAYASRAATSRH